MQSSSLAAGIERVPPEFSYSVTKLRGFVTFWMRISFSENMLMPFRLVFASILISLGV